MRTLLLSPHADDETLFAAWTIVRFRPAVWVVHLPEDRVEREQRQQELVRALRALFDVPDSDRANPYWNAVGGYEGQECLSLRGQLVKVCPPVSIHDRDPDLEDSYYDHVFAPAVEPHGHAEHNAVGQAALDVFGPERVTQYLTYTRDGGRSSSARQVLFEPGWVARKLRALACYESQHAHEQRAPWFVDLIDLREWYAETPGPRDPGLASP